MDKNKLSQIIVITFLALGLSGCFLTKVVTVPLRVAGAAASVIPVVGDAVDGTLDVAADAVDFIPL